MTHEEANGLLRNALNRMREERNAARDLISILMRQIARVERENHQLREEVRIGISLD